MQTASISYRVVDFLKKHPPFHAMHDEDLLNLAHTGKVRFFEKNEFIVWQGASRFEILVIQQGVTSLWEEVAGVNELRDVRGAGDMLGIDQFQDAGFLPYSARAATDVLIYAFPAKDFEDLVLKYPYAAQYLSAHANVMPEFQSTEGRRNPQHVFVHDLVARKTLWTCNADDSIRKAAKYMRSTGADAIMVLDSNQRLCGVLTPDSFLEWIERGGVDAQQPIKALLHAAPQLISSDASVTDAILEMTTADAGALVMTSGGDSGNRPHAIVTPQDFAKVFGDQPVAILREIRRTSRISALRELQQRSRAFALQYLTSADSFDWLARFMFLADSTLVQRIIELAEPGDSAACWCFCATSGRGESLVGVAPQILLILDDQREAAPFLQAHQRVLESFSECGYLPSVNMPFEASFYAAGLAEWKQRYGDWVRDPILKEMYRARPLFDLRPIHGPHSLWREIQATVTSTVNEAFLHVLANDCFSSLPPLTFFKDAVVEESGGHISVFRLEDSALKPLVDVGRVFGIAARKVLGSSTLERFAMARSLLPKHESIFREASDTLRVLLWQQGRIGISQGTAGAELPPALLSRYDRQVLRNGFRSIHRLLEFTADREWLKML